MGTLHSEFFMKRTSGLKRQIKQGPRRLSQDGLKLREEFDVCRLELQDQSAVLTGVLNQELLPALAEVVRLVADLSWENLKLCSRDDFVPEHWPPIPAQAACHPTRRFRTKNLQGRMIARPVRQ